MPVKYFPIWLATISSISAIIYGNSIEAKLSLMKGGKLIMVSRRALVGSSKDNVAVAVEDVAAGEKVKVEGKQKSLTLDAIESIPFGFKISLDNLPEGSDIIRYGEIIGRATVDIKKGAQVHVHNIDGRRVQSGGGGK
jgi:altronate dehydratase small subunit